MKARHLASLLLAVSASFAAPAFASGYGPAPFYSPHEGAPASQRGQSAQTLATEHGDATDAQQAYGGMPAEQSQSGARVALESPAKLFAHH